MHKKFLNSIFLQVFSSHQTWSVFFCVLIIAENMKTNSAVSWSSETVEIIKGKRRLHDIEKDKNFLTSRIDVKYRSHNFIMTQRHFQHKKTSSWVKRRKILNSFFQFLQLLHMRIFLPTSVVFRKMYLLKRAWNSGFLWLLILSYHKLHLSWTLHWYSSSRPKNMKTFSVDINYFHQFWSILWIFWDFLVTKKLMTSTYNRWCQHFLTFNMLETNCLTIA